MLRQIASLIFAALVVSGPLNAAELVMVEEPGCVYCEQWNTEISEIYPKTPEGKAAPLVRVVRKTNGMHDYDFARPVVFTPTFVLVADGAELARIEGYPGEDFFWGLLGMMLKQHTGFEGAS